MAYRGFSNIVRGLQRQAELRVSTHLLGCCRSYSRVTSNVNGYNNGGILYPSHGNQNSPPWTPATATNSLYAKTTELSIVFRGMSTLKTSAKAPPQARQMGALQVTMLSPGFVYEPYTPREPVSFWQRWFTRNGWRRTKEDIIVELKSAYAIAKLRKSGYSKQKFYTEAIQLYKEINYLLAHGDRKALRKMVTERMFSTLKNDIKQRESMWSKVYWEMVEPAVKIRTLRARLIGVDRNDLNKVFVQLTLEFLTKQKFEAYDSNGVIVAGDKSKEIVDRVMGQVRPCPLQIINRAHDALLGARKRHLGVREITLP